MAKVKFGMMMTDARGKLGGQVFSKNRGGSYVRTKVTPTNPQTSFQNGVRALFGQISQNWSGLTEAQRTAWRGAVDQWQRTDVFGDLKRPSGKALFQRLNQQAQTANYPAIVLPPQETAVDSYAIEQLDIAIGAGTITATPSGDSNLSALVISATPPMTQGTKFVKDKLRQIYAEINDTVQPLGVYQNYVAKFGVPSVGDNIVFGFKYVGPNGNSTPIQTFKATIVA